MQQTQPDVRRHIQRNLLGFAITSITIQVYIFANYKVGRFHGEPLPKSKLSHFSLAVGISTSLDSSVAYRLFYERKGRVPGSKVGVTLFCNLGFIFFSNFFFLNCLIPKFFSQIFSIS